MFESQRNLTQRKAYVVDAFSDPFDVPTVDSNDPLQNVESVVDLPFCRVSISRDLFRPPLFNESALLKTTNRVAIRLGASSDIMTLLQGEDSDYLQGMVATSVVATVVFVVAALVILCLKCAGYKREGFLSGRFVRRRETSKDISLPNSQLYDNDFATSEEDITRNEKLYDEASSFDGEEKKMDGMSMEQSYRDQETIKRDSVFRDTSEEQRREGIQGEPQHDVNTIDMQKNEFVFEDDGPNQYSQQKRRMFRTRVAFFIATVCTIYSCLLFCAYGTKYMDRTFHTVRDGLEHIQDLCQGAIVVIDNLLIREEAVSNTTRAEIRTFNGICPKASTALCDTSELFDTCDFDQLPIDDLRDSVEQVFSEIFEETAYLFQEIRKVRQDLQAISDDLESFLSGENQLEWAFWVSFGFTVAVSALCLFNIWLLLMAHIRRVGPVLSFLRAKILFPLWILFTVLALAFGVAFVLAAVGASDWCINSPDPKVSYILEKRKPSLAL